MQDPLVDRLNEIRERDGLTYLSLAELLGVDQAYVYRVLKGQGPMGRKLLDGALRAYPELRQVYADSLTVRHEQPEGEREEVPA